MRRVVSLYLPTWPTDRIRRRTGGPPPDEPLVTVIQDGSRRLIAAVDVNAHHLGLRPGLTAAHAKALVPNLQLQLIHEDDVGEAFLRCILAIGPPGAYNIAGDGVLTAGDVAREFGLAPLPFPGGVVMAGARAIASIPLPSGAPPATEWVEAISRPSIMDTAKAKRELGWEPKYSGIESLRDTLQNAD